MKFKLEIELGNDAMLTGMDVARALKEVVKKLVVYYQDRRKITREDSGGIMDLNGNTVGTWRFVKDERPMDAEGIMYHDKGTEPEV